MSESNAKVVLTVEQERLVESVAAFGRAAGAIGRAALRAVAPVRAIAWQSYRAAGMPYGESEDGLLRWLRQCKRAQDLRDEADQIEAMHATYARLRAGKP